MTLTIGQVAAAAAVNLQISRSVSWSIQKLVQRESVRPPERQ